MYTKRATILSPKSLANLHKVCSPRGNASDCLKIVTFLRRNLGSANGLPDFENHFGTAQNPRTHGQSNDGGGGGFQGSSTGYYHQSYNGVSGESHGYSGFGGQTGQNSSSSFGGVNRQNDGDFRNGVNVERLGNEGFSGSTLESGNFRGYYGQNNGVPSSSHLQNRNGVSAERLGNGSGNFNGYFGQNNGRFDTNVNGQSLSSSRTVGPMETRQHNPGGFGSQGIATEVNAEKPSNGDFSGSTGQSGNFSGYYGQNNEGFDQRRLDSNTNGRSEENGNTQSSYSSRVAGPAETRQQNPGGFRSQGIATEVNAERPSNGGFSGSTGKRGNFSGYYGQNNGGFDQFRSDLNVSNQSEESGNIQSSYGSRVTGPTETRRQNPGGFGSQGIARFEGNRSGSYTESYRQFQQSQQSHWPNSDNFNNPTVVNQVPTYPISEGILGVVDPLAELDRLCNEGKVKEAMELLKSLEQRKITVDLPRYLRFMQVCGEVGATEEAKAVRGDMLRCHPNQIGNGQTTSGYYYGQNQANTGGFGSQGVDRFQGNPSGPYTESHGQFQNQQSYSLNSNDFNNSPVETIPARDPLAELDGFCNEGKVKEAVELLKSLEEQKVTVDLPRYLRLMQVCGDVEALEEAKAVHADLLRSHPNPSVSAHNKILEMYSRCGSMEDADSVFRTMPEQNLSTWDTMITWLARNGHGEEAIDLFTEFKKAGFKPDGNMFAAVFDSCGVVGDVYEGMCHFESMSRDFGIVPTMEHYESVVDMLGSTGYLDEALDFVEKMPFEPSVGVWENLMISCRVHGDTVLGDRCAELVEKLQPSRLSEQSKAGLVPVNPSDLSAEKAKKKARNPLEVRSRVHEYRAGDTSHPENDKIYAKLRALREHMKEMGYVAETRFVLHDIDQESKEEALLSHSERLAVAYSLLSTSARSPVRIIKNLRACGDCHTALKIISKIVGRELIIRDAKRFHHFKDGSCSCRDYW